MCTHVYHWTQVKILQSDQFPDKELQDRMYFYFSYYTIGLLGRVIIHTLIVVYSNAQAKQGSAQN